MKLHRTAGLLFVLALTLMACSLARVGPTPAPPTLTQLPATPTAAQPTATALPTSTSLATQPPLPDPHTATAEVAMTATWQGMTEVSIALIAPEDNGASGPMIGCGDSVIFVTRQLGGPTQSPLRAAYEELLSVDDYNYGQSGLINPLEASDLTVDSVNIRDGVAIIQLSGTLALIGTCADAAIEAQLVHTALQFASVEEVQVTINGTPLHDLISQE